MALLVNGPFPDPVFTKTPAPTRPAGFLAVLPVKMTVLLKFWPSCWQKSSSCGSFGRPAGSGGVLLKFWLSCRFRSRPAEGETVLLGVSEGFEGFLFKIQQTQKMGKWENGEMGFCSNSVSSSIGLK
jgi:hypothetical protein